MQRCFRLRKATRLSSPNVLRRDRPTRRCDRFQPPFTVHLSPFTNLSSPRRGSGYCSPKIMQRPSRLASRWNVIHWRLGLCAMLCPFHFFFSPFTLGQPIAVPRKKSGLYFLWVCQHLVRVVAKRNGNK